MDYGSIAFQNLLKLIEEHGITAQNKLFLEVLLPKKLLERSLRLIDQEAHIKYYFALLSERSFWIFNTHSQTYCVFCDRESCFCTCQSYENDVIAKGRYPFCKHILAAFICNALRKKGDTTQFIVEEISDDEFSSVMANTVVSAVLVKK